SHLLCTAVRGGQGLIVPERVQGREPGITVSMKEEDFAAACRKRRQIGRRRLYQRIGGMQSLFVDIDLGRGRIRTEEADGAESEQPRKRTGLRDTGVIRKPWVHLRAVGVLGSCKRLLDGCNLFPCNAAIALAALAVQHRRIEIAAHRIGDHPVDHAVLCVAPIHQRIHEALSLMNLSSSGFPDASLGAAWLYATGIHLPMARFERPVRIAGSPEMMPLKTAG